MKVKLREMRLSDAKRFFEILNHPDFEYFPVKPATINEEKKFLRGIKKLRKEKLSYPFSVIAGGKHVGAAGIVINKQFPYRCAIGYFIDRKFWNRGIATEAVKLLEKFIEKNLDVVRVEIITATKNVASQFVAIKSGYKKEGRLKKYLKVGDKFHDCYIYGKILK